VEVQSPTSGARLVKLVPLSYGRIPRHESAVTPPPLYDCSQQHHCLIQVASVFESVCELAYHRDNRCFSPSSLYLSGTVAVGLVGQAPGAVVQ